MYSSRIKVGFFDSGIGGLTTLNDCVKYAEQFVRQGIDYTFYYYGDNFHAPYGNLSSEKINAYVDKAFEKFVDLQVDAVVLACNTVTAVCVERLRKKHAFPIVGIEPAIFSAVKSLPNGKGEILTLSTRATFLSNRFKCLCARVKKFYPKVILKNYPCDGLAGAIEKRAFQVDFDCSDFLLNCNPSIVVLGCTHYVYVKSFIRSFYSCPTVDGNSGVARRLFSLLDDCGKPNDTKKVNFVDKADLPLKGKDIHFFVDKSVLRTKVDFIEQNLQIDEKNRDGKPLVTPNEKMPQNPEIVFVGEAKMVNKTKYEQMFANKTGQNGW